MLDKTPKGDELDDIVDDILEKVDENGDGEIAEWEFIHHAMKCPFLADLIENHTGWMSWKSCLNINVNRQNLVNGTDIFIRKPSHLVLTKTWAIEYWMWPV